MFIDEPFWKRLICFAPAGDPPAGDPPAGDPPAGDPPAGDPPPGDPPAGDPPAAKWWENTERFSEPQRTSLTALGLTVEDPLDALPKLLEMEASAKRRLGASPDQLMQKPKEGQEVSDWLRENGDTLGIPKEAEGYEVSRPESWPKDADWNIELETAARQIAHEEGITGKGLNRMVELYASSVQKLTSAAEDELAGSTQEMMAELKSDWGAQTTAKITMAKQAMSVLAEKAGFDSETVMNVSKVLTDKAGGDANAVRLFATIGEMMGEDSLVGLNTGGAGLGTSPAEARQKLAQLRSPEGDYGKAFGDGNAAKMRELQPEIERLTKLAAG